MPTLQFQTFFGLNRRAALEVAPPRSLYLGKNVDITLGRSLKARGALKKVADVHPQSRGLYASGGTLRTAIPGGQGFPLEVFGTTRIKYDHLGGDYAPFSTGTVTCTKGSVDVVLAGGTWPVDIVGAEIYLPGSGASGSVATRVDGTTVKLVTPWVAPTVAGAAFILRSQATSYPLDTLIDVTAQEQIGSSREMGGYPYLVAERWVDPLDTSKGVRFEHHWITGGFLDPNVPPATLVTLPFAPGAGLAKLNGRLWATDETGSQVRFSSIQFGPRNWTAVGDAGFISVLDHALGDRSANGLGVFNDRLAVIFSDAVQLWHTAEDPTQIAFVRALGGPGTDAVASVVNVRGDLFYFTRGGFRSLYTQSITGQTDENDDIGAGVYDLTRDLDGALARAVWSQRRGCYLCAFGSQVFVYRLSPMSKVTEWTTWEFPGLAISEVVEFNGNLYLRAGATVYQMSEDADDTVDWEVQFHFAQGRDRHTRRRWDFIEIIQTGTADVDFAAEPTRPTTYFPAPPGHPIRVTGSTTGVNRVYVGALSPLLSTRFRGRGPWQLDSFALSYTQLPW